MMTTVDCWMDKTPKHKIGINLGLSHACSSDAIHTLSACAICCQAQPASQISSKLILVVKVRIKRFPDHRRHLLLLPRVSQILPINISLAASYYSNHTRYFTSVEYNIA